MHFPVLVALSPFTEYVTNVFSAAPQAFPGAVQIQSGTN